MLVCNEDVKAALRKTRKRDTEKSVHYILFSLCVDHDPQIHRQWWLTFRTVSTGHSSLLVVMAVVYQYL